MFEASSKKIIANKIGANPNQYLKNFVLFLLKNK